jgi:hypothetical protein
VNVLDGYVFGATAAPMGAVASALVGEQVRELLAAFGVAGGAAVGSTVAAGLLARFVVKHVAGKSARVEDAGEYSGIAGQIGAWLGAGGADRPAPWSLDEWAKVAAIGAAGIALDAALAVAFPGALSLEIGVSAGFEEWGWFQVARSHRRHGHVPGATQR